MNTISSEQKPSQPLTSRSQNPQSQTSMLPIQSSNCQHRFNAQCSPLVLLAMYYPSYPSSTLHTCYLNPPSPQNFAHISSPPLHFSPVLYGQGPLLSASQSHVSTIRGSPLPFSICPPDSNIDPWASPAVHYESPLLSPL
jgi:hypothetical protein